MDPDLLDPDLIFAKTPSGEEAMLQRTRVVQRNTRMVLILVDGNATVAELCDKTGNAQLTENALLELENDGFIERRIEKNSVWRQDRNAARRSKAAPPPAGFRVFHVWRNRRIRAGQVHLAGQPGQTRHPVPWQSRQQANGPAPRLGRHRNACLAADRSGIAHDLPARR